MGGAISLAGVARRKSTLSEVRFGPRTNNEASAASWVETSYLAEGTAGRTRV